MKAYFREQVSSLQASIHEMGLLAGRLLGEAVASFETKDAALAREIVLRDSELDQLEDEHEEQTIQLIALSQPVASDLRTLVAFLRINQDIERVGDLAVNIAQSTLRTCDLPALRPYVDIPRSYELVRVMWNDVLSAFATMDEEQAASMRRRDDAIDKLNQETIMQLIEIGRDAPSLIFQVTNLIGVSRNLERTADLSVDICDEILFVCRGQLRHQRRQRRTA